MTTPAARQQAATVGVRKRRQEEHDTERRKGKREREREVGEGTNLGSLVPHGPARADTHTRSKTQTAHTAVTSQTRGDGGAVTGNERGKGGTAVRTLEPAALSTRPAFADHLLAQ